MNRESDRSSRRRQRGSLALVAGLVLVVCLGNLPEASAGSAVVRPGQFGARVSGTVTDSDGNPLGGVAVTIAMVVQNARAPYPDIKLETSDEGIYFARNVRVARVTISYALEGYQPLVKEVSLRVGPNKFNVQLQKIVIPESVKRANAANDAYGAGRQAFSERRFDEAITLMREALGNIDDRPENHEALSAVYSIIGRSYLEERSYPEAVEAYKKWAELAPEDAAPHLELAQTYSAMNDEESAAGEFKRALDLDPTDPMSHYNVGVVMINAGQVGNGIAELEETLALQPHYPLAHKNLGYAYARVEQYAKAIEHFQSYLEQDPEAADKADIEQFIAALKEMIGG